ncbi:hypothetical protein ACA910_020922 [Epithemia clementina (nom. ined.)]
MPKQRPQEHFTPEIPPPPSEQQREPRPRPSPSGIQPQQSLSNRRNPAETAPPPPKQQQQQQQLAPSNPTTELPRFFSQSDVQAIRDSVDIVSVVEAYELEQFQRRHNYNAAAMDSATALCPFHDDHKPSLNVDASRGLFKCFACGAGGDVFHFVRQMHLLDNEKEMTFGDAVRLVHQEFVEQKHGNYMINSNNSSLPFSLRQQRRRSIMDINNSGENGVPLTVEQLQQRHILYRANAAAASFYVNGLVQLPAGHARRYLTVDRGLTPSVLRRFSVGFAPDAYFGNSRNNNNNSSAVWGQGSLVQHLHQLNFTAQQMVDAGLAVVVQSRQNSNKNKKKKQDEERLSKQAAAATASTVDVNTTMHFIGDHDNEEDDQLELSIDRIMDRFRGRIMVPILDADGKHVVGFGGRILPPFDTRSSSLSDRGEFHGPKYLNSPETLVFHKQNLLFGQHLVGSRSNNKNQVETKVVAPPVNENDKITKNQRGDVPLAIVEGYLDAISLASVGMERVVASMGTSISMSQLEQAAEIATDNSNNSNNVIVLCLDQDEAGQAAVERLCRERMLSKVSAKYAQQSQQQDREQVSPATLSNIAVEFRVAQPTLGFSDPAALVEHLQQVGGKNHVASNSPAKEATNKNQKTKKKRKTTQKSQMDALEEKLHAERHSAFVDQSLREELLDSAIPWREWYIQRILSVFDRASNNTREATPQPTARFNKNMTKGDKERVVASSSNYSTSLDAESDVSIKKKSQQQKDVSRVFYQLASLLSDQPNSDERVHLAHFAANALVTTLTATNSTSLPNSTSNANATSAGRSISSSSPTTLLKEELAADLLDLASRLEATLNSNSGDNQDVDYNQRVIRNVQKGTMPFEAALLHRSPGATAGRVPDLSNAEKLSSKAAAMGAEVTGEMIMPSVKKAATTKNKDDGSMIQENIKAVVVAGKGQRRSMPSKQEATLSRHFAGFEFLNRLDKEWLESTIPERGQGRSQKKLLVLGAQATATAGRFGYIRNVGSNRFKDPVYFHSNEYHGKKFLTDDAKAAGYKDDFTLTESLERIFEKGVASLVERSTNSVATVVEDLLLRELILRPVARSCVKKWFHTKQALHRLEVDYNDDNNDPKNFEWSSDEKKWLFQTLVLDEDHNLDLAGAMKPSAVRRALSTRRDVPWGAFYLSDETTTLGDVEASHPSSFVETEVGVLEHLFVDLSSIEEELSSSSSSETHMDFNLQGLLVELSWVSARRESESIQQKLLEASEALALSSANSSLNESNDAVEIDPRAEHEEDRNLKLVSSFNENLARLRHVSMKLRSIEDLRQRISTGALDASNAHKVEGRIPTFVRARTKSEMDSFVSQMGHDGTQGESSKLDKTPEEPHQKTLKRMKNAWGEWFEDDFYYTRPDTVSSGRPRAQPAAQAQTVPPVYPEEQEEVESEHSLQYELDKMDRDWADWVD